MYTTYYMYTYDMYTYYRYTYHMYIYYVYTCGTSYSMFPRSYVLCSK